MTTSLVAGLTRAQATEAVRLAAVALANASGGLGVHTEQGKTSVMVGIARVGGITCVVEIDRTEYDPMGGLKLAELMGFELVKKGRA